MNHNFPEFRIFQMIMGHHSDYYSKSSWFFLFLFMSPYALEFLNYNRTNGWHKWVAFRGRNSNYALIERNALMIFSDCLWPEQSYTNKCRVRLTAPLFIALGSQTLSSNIVLSIQARVYVRYETPSMLSGEFTIGKFLFRFSKNKKWMHQLCVNTTSQSQNHSKSITSTNYFKVFNTAASTKSKHFLVIDDI